MFPPRHLLILATLAWAIFAAPAMASRVSPAEGKNQTVPLIASLDDKGAWYVRLPNGLLPHLDFISPVNHQTVTPDSLTIDGMSHDSTALPLLPPISHVLMHELGSLPSGGPWIDSSIAQKLWDQADASGLSSDEVVAYVMLRRGHFFYCQGFVLDIESQATTPPSNPNPPENPNGPGSPVNPVNPVNPVTPPPDNNPPPDKNPPPDNNPPPDITTPDVPVFVPVPPAASMALVTLAGLALFTALRRRPQPR